MCAMVAQKKRKNVGEVGWGTWVWFSQMKLGNIVGNWFWSSVGKSIMGRNDIWIGKVMGWQSSRTGAVSGVAGEMSALDILHWAPWWLSTLVIASYVLPDGKSSKGVSEPQPCANSALVRCLSRHGRLSTIYWVNGWRRKMRTAGCLCSDQAISTKCQSYLHTFSQFLWYNFGSKSPFQTQTTHTFLVATSLSSLITPWLLYQWSQFLPDSFQPWEEGSVSSRLPSPLIFLPAFPGVMTTMTFCFCLK